MGNTSLNPKVAQKRQRQPNSNPIQENAKKNKFLQTREIKKHKIHSKNKKMNLSNALNTVRIKFITKNQSNHPSIMNTCTSIFDESGYQYRQLFYPNTTSVEEVVDFSNMLKRRYQYLSDEDRMSEHIVLCQTMCALMCALFGSTAILSVTTAVFAMCCIWFLQACEYVCTLVSVLVVKLVAPSAPVKCTATQCDLRLTANPRRPITQLKNGHRIDWDALSKHIPSSD